MLKQIRLETEQAVQELLETASLKGGDLFVVGCSTSEVAGEHIGKAGSMEIAQAIFEGIYPALCDRGIYLAAQCCEHLNRALVIEQAVARTMSYEPVAVVPQPKAGGSFGTTAYRGLEAPVVVETVRARAGLDIGGTLIGMHLVPVVVPVRLRVRAIGGAGLIAARTRPKYIGGERAVY